MKNKNPAKRAEKENVTYHAPTTTYCTSQEEFDQAVGKDFIEHANKCTGQGEKFLVGLSHGISPSGAYEYLLENYASLHRPEYIRYTFVNSKLKRQRGLEGVTDAVGFLQELLKSKRIDKDQILGRTLDRENMEAYAKGLNEKLGEYLKIHYKDGLDYIFLASDSKGRVAGITRRSTAFGSTDFGAVVVEEGEKELTLTPAFISRTKRIAFIVTKSDKRRALAWLFYRWGEPDQSPSFLRHIDNVKERMTVFVDNRALTWPQISIERETKYGPSTIRMDLPKPYGEFKNKKLPVIVLLHGFLGLNTFDGLLIAIPTHKYIAVAMHYGSIPNDLPPNQYSQHVLENIDHVVKHFGEKGHPVYLFDHSMGNIYFLMMDQQFDQLEGVKKYLKGRIGANPFFGEEAKHALMGFMDSVLIPSVSYSKSTIEKVLFNAARTIIPWDSRRGVRSRGIALSEWLISKETSVRDRVWKTVKKRILFLMTNMGSLPHLDQIPIARALGRLPAKVFAIQTHSALLESKKHDTLHGLENMPANGVPVMILKSDRDGVAKYVPRLYEDGYTEIVDVTNTEEYDFFREHLYHMVRPLATTKIIDKFIMDCVEKNSKVNQGRKKRA